MKTVTFQFKNLFLLTTGWRLGLTITTLIRDTVDIRMKYEIDRVSANTSLPRPPVLLYRSLDDVFFLFPNQVYPNSLTVTAINLFTGTLI